MADEPRNDNGESVTSIDTETKKEEKKGFLSRFWNAVFNLRGDDFEKRLKHIFNEEAVVLSRISKRSHFSRKMTRCLIILSVLSELFAVGFAVLTTTGSVNLNWKMRAPRVLPMFLLPLFCFLAYSALTRFTRMCDRKDHSTIEKLRAERQAKIDELKEKTNYYTTQQLIQRYDTDPAAQQAAATVLASKLGADAGLKVYVGDESKPSEVTGQSHDVEVANAGGGLRKRKNPTPSEISRMESAHTRELDIAGTSEQHPLVVDHHPQAAPSASEGGWIARLAALLVGEDSTQSYALICGNCHMHNGLSRKEDFPYITYYCPHCKALNRPPTQSSDDHHQDTAAQVVEVEPIAATGGSDADSDTSGNSSPQAHAAEDSGTMPESS